MTQPHGTRAAYQAGCQCLPCRAANAAYIGHLRGLQRRGKSALGQYVSAKATQQRIQQLLQERFTKGEIARCLGLKRRILEVHPDVVRVKTALRIRLLWRERMTGEGPDQPLNV